MATLCLDASLGTLRPLLSPHAPSLGGSLSLPSQGISSGSPGCWHFWHAMSSKTAHSFLSRITTSALHESQFSALVKARRFLRSHSWVVLAFSAGTKSCWKTHSRPVKKAMLRCFTTPCSTSSWYTRTHFHPFHAKMKMSHPLMGHLPPNHDVGRAMASLQPQNESKGTFEHEPCSTGCYTAPRWWKFSRPWWECFHARFRRATGGDALLLSVGFPSKQE